MPRYELTIMSAIVCPALMNEVMICVSLGGGSSMFLSLNCHMLPDDVDRVARVELGDVKRASSVVRVHRRCALALETAFTVRRASLVKRRVERCRREFRHSMSRIQLLRVCLLPCFD